ncbi:hypothetical protein BN946_scf184760.g13 [Trametes cinnabarina]|uniref:Membrane anchor Opy2 N-terminal domain-containing protein n=1 Tax=Pycnoporus cinnabarinus TaxID=5643 RepID=A0A060S258_PYCCI|nr:hypothetical protein BN946_scf184760.g13 [Trametes cinnabarina]
MPGKTARRLYPRESSNATTSDGCAICNDAPPDCNCAWNEQCVVTVRHTDGHSMDLQRLPHVPPRGVLPNPALEPSGAASVQSHHRKGLSKGAIAAAVVVPVLVVLAAAAAIALLLYSRRRRLQARAAAEGSQSSLNRTAVSPSLPGTNAVLDKRQSRWLPISSLYSRSANGTSRADSASDAAHGQRPLFPVYTDPFADRGKHDW